MRTELWIVGLLVAVFAFGCSDATCGDFELDRETDMCICPAPFVFADDRRTCECPAPMVRDGDTCITPDGGDLDGGCGEGETRDCTADALGECANGTETCAGGVWGVCVPGAATAELCDGLDNDCDGSPDGLAASAACADLPMTESSVCTAGTCVIAECVAGFDDCNGDASDGCEVDLSTNIDHCGECENACTGIDLCSERDCVAPPLHEWSVSIQSEVFDVLDVAVDDAENVYVVGEFISSLTVDGVTRAGTGLREGYLVSLDADGSFRWLVTVQGSGSESLAGVVPMPDGSICAAGRFDHPASFVDATGEATPLTSVASRSALLACVDSTGRRVWTERFGGTGGSLFRDLAVDSESNLYVTGEFEGSVDFGMRLASRGDDDVVVASYDSDGTHRWCRSFGSSMADGGTAIAVRGSDLFIGGVFNQSIAFGGTTLTASGRAGYLAEFDTMGNHVESVAFGPAPRSGFVRELRAFPGRVVVAGLFSGTVDLLGVSRGATDTDGYVAVLNDELSAVDVVQLEGTDFQGWSAVAVLDESLFLSGGYREGAVLEGAALPDRTLGSAVLAAYDREVEWHATFGSPGGADASAVIESGANHLIFAGEHSGVNFGGSTLDPGGGRGGFVVKYRVR